jgi:hypothetical protein
MVAAATACVFPVSEVAVSPLRKDLFALPTFWLVSVALVWLAGFVVPLALAIVPPQGHVLPSSSRAGRAALLTSLTLVLVGFLFTVDAPGVTLLPRTTWAGFLPAWWRCISFSLKVTAPAVVVAAVLLRRLSVARLWHLGAAVGAAAGALSGLTRHLLCPYGGAAHVALAHGGGVAVGALLGALGLPLLIWSDRAERARS